MFLHENKKISINPQARQNINTIKYRINEYVHIKTKREKNRYRVNDLRTLLYS